MCLAQIERQIERQIVRRQMRNISADFFRQLRRPLFWRDYFYLRSLHPLLVIKVWKETKVFDKKNILAPTGSFFSNRKKERGGCQKWTNILWKTYIFEDIWWHFICGAERALQKYNVFCRWTRPNEFSESFGPELNRILKRLVFVQIDRQTKNKNSKNSKNVVKNFRSADLQVVRRQNRYISICSS